jgi:iron uptake system component EfeO
MSSSVSRPPRLLRAALAGSVIAMVAAGGLFYYAAQLAAEKRETHLGQETLVTIKDHRCEPAAISVPAGHAAFRIVNASDRAVEWEILDGVLVLEERENIAPGMSQLIDASLEPGHYSITCGLLSNARGALTVTATAESTARAKAKPSMAALIGPLSEYRVYLSQQGTALVKASTALSMAIDANDLAAARSAYAAARMAYQRIAAAAQRFSDLNNAIDAQADYYEQREADPAFLGFHRLEYGLFGPSQGADAALPAVAHRLVQDVTRLKAQLLAQPIPPDQLVSMVARNLRSLAEQRFEGQEERYSQLALDGFAANLDGASKVAALMRPLLDKTAAAQQEKVQAALDALAQELHSLRNGDHYPSYDQVSQAQRRDIAERARALANAMDGIDPALGLSAL